MKTEYHKNKRIPTEIFQHDRKKQFLEKFLPFTSVLCGYTGKQAVLLDNDGTTEWLSKLI